MKKLFLLLFPLFLFTLTASAQNQWEAGINIMPSASNFHAKGATHYQYQYIFPVNYGARVNFTSGSFLFSTGVLHLTQGTRLEIEKTSTTNPEGGGEFFHLYSRARIFAVPLNAYYSFASAGPVDFFGGLGVYLGYVYSQQEENTSIPEDYQPGGTVTDSSPQRYVDVNYYDSFYAGANAAVGARYQLSDSFVLEAKPSFLFQIKEELPREKADWTVRLMSFSVDLGLYYRF